MDVEIPAALTDLDSYNITTYKDVEFGGYGQRTGIAFSGAEDFDLIEPDYDTDIVNVTTGETGSFTDVLTRKQELEANPEKFRKWSCMTISSTKRLTLSPIMGHRVIRKY